MVLSTRRTEGNEDQGEHCRHQDGREVLQSAEWPEPHEGIQTHHQGNYNFRERNLAPEILRGIELAINCSRLSCHWLKTATTDKGIISRMTDFRFYHLIEVRYGDLDPQGHVNNAKFLTYMEQGRVFYLKQLKLWEGGSFLDIGVILADVQITFRKASHFGDRFRVGVRVSHIGNKSMTSEYRIEDARDASEFGTGSSVLVAYDYRNRRSVPIPEEWRPGILHFKE